MPPTKPVNAARPATTSSQVGASPHLNGNGNGKLGNLQIPLRSILAGLPLELRARVLKVEVGDLAISVALDKILSQLGGGVVKVSFGEIRRAATHVFTSATDCDRVAVVLPLAEIISRINPALLVRRPSQKKVEVPADIISPFGAHGQGLVFSVGSPKSESVATPQIAAPAPPHSVVPVAATPRIPSPPVPPPSALPEQIFKRTSSPPVAPVPPVKPAAAPPPKEPAPSKDYFSAMPVPRAVQPAKPATPPAETATLTVSLSSLAQNWPEALRQEIVQFKLAEARLALPIALVEAALKRGRVIFPWRTLRSWIRPAPLPNVSAHDGVELELPLSVVAPLFLGLQKAAEKPQQQVTIDEGIPNLFFGLPKPEPTSSPAAAVAKPADTNYYVWDDNSDTAFVDESEIKRSTPTGTDFISRYATPNEIVSRAAALDGVAGALIALPDGLMVANRIPPELNGDTLAAFLPQIFAKVSQTTRELRMGDLNNLNFTVGNTPWKIFRVNAIFFAAFGRTGEGLPTGQLAALAAELDRKNK